MNRFDQLVEYLLNDQAEKKGYGPHLAAIVRGMPHPLGEIIYKAVRYHHRHDPSDLVKIAAWAKLLYEEDARARANSGNIDNTQDRPGNGEGGGDARAVPGWIARTGGTNFVRGSWRSGKGGIKLHPSDRRRGHSKKA